VVAKPQAPFRGEITLAVSRSAGPRIDPFARETYIPHLSPLLAAKTVVQRGGRVAVCALAGAIGVTLTVGCALFGPLDAESKVSTQRSVLPPLRPSADAVQLHVAFVDRPADDALASQRIWQELDEVGAVPPAQRAILHDNGLRVAQCGASVPPTVQTLLGLAEEINPGDAATRNRQLNVLSGQESELLICDQPKSCGVRFLLNGQDELMEFEQARAVLRVRPVRLQDGWVRLEFTPEIHHGDPHMRHAATGDGWALRGGQKTDIRQPLKFQVTLNTGEMVIIGAAAGSPESLGQQFFHHEAHDRMQQRLIVIRLADSGHSQRGNGNEP